MKRGTLNFLGRKNHSLFDTSVKMQDMDNVELVLDSAKISESGTANVRARPTVKHTHASVVESFQGFAVPTPKVPLLPPTNGPKVNGTAAGDKLSNGSVMSDHVDDEIFVPPPPSMSPPPPPLNFIPPPGFMGDMNSLDLAALQPPSMPAPKLPPSMKEEDLSNLKPPAMAPPKPPSTSSSGSASSVPTYIPPPPNVPEPPTFSPPKPPLEKQLRTQKIPPAKPTRLSSISLTDSPPHSPAPPPPVDTPSLSTFNPKNKAKVYDSPKATFLGKQEDHMTRPKQMLLLEDSKSGNSVPVLVDGNVAQLSKTDPKEVQKPKEDIKDAIIAQTPQKPKADPKTEPKAEPKTEPKAEPKTETVSIQPETIKPLEPPQQQKVNNVQTNSEASKNKLDSSPGQSRSFSPMLDRKLRNLKANDTTGARDAHAASPLALLQAAKERDKQRANISLSRESSTRISDDSSSGIHPSDSSPNSFIVVPKSSSASSTPLQERLQEIPQPVGPVEPKVDIQAPETSSNPKIQWVSDKKPSNGPTLSSATVNKVAQEKQTAKEQPSKPQAVWQKDHKEDLNMPVLPPPPEFGDFFEIMEPPPSICPPSPPAKKTPMPAVGPPPPAPHPHTPPKLPPPDTDIKLKPQVKTKTKSTPNQLPPTLSANQATLLSILQKKMIEMDQKMAPVNETESSPDDWGTTASEDSNKVPVVRKAKTQPQPPPTNNKPASMDMKELESKLVKKYQESPKVKSPTSDGAKSRQQYGMTFTVRPGTKQPITLVNKEES
nr:uncharacterized protein LOC107385748 [Nothobranchius furzeri]